MFAEDGQAGAAVHREQHCTASPAPAAAEPLCWQLPEPLGRALGETSTLGHPTTSAEC